MMMRSQSSIIPSWNTRNQEQLLFVPQQLDKTAEVVVEEQQKHEMVNTAADSHVHLQHQHLQKNPTLSMPNYEVAELTWENGQLAMHGLGSCILPPATAQTSKPTWVRTSHDTLESIVHQATYQNQLAPKQNDSLNEGNMSSIVASSSGKWGDSSSHVPTAAPSFLKKRVRSSPSYDTRRNLNCNIHEECPNDMSACASVSATMSKDNDTTMMTWPSFDSPNWSFKSKNTDDDDISENQEEHKTKGEMTPSRSTRRSRAAAVHNQSERRRRDRINQKMKALQKLVPNASKTDKASMLDEVIEYLRNLQAQIHMMNSLRNMPAAQMMMPMPLQQMQQQQQQQLQMSMLARMGMGNVGLGMGMGMGMMPQSLSPALIPQNHLPSTNNFVPPQFIMPQMIPGHAASQMRNGSQTTNASVPFTDPYSALLTQSMNMEMYNKMATLYRQQVSQAAKSMASPPMSKGE